MRAGAGGARRLHAVRLAPRSLAALAAVSFVGLAAFAWPFVADPGSSAVAHSSDAPWLFAALLPLVLAVVLAQLSDGGLDAKGVALLGVLAAVVAALRPLGAGTAGLEPVWVVLVLAGRVMGPGFGFALGSVAMFASGLLTAGVGPWLPFQMLGAGWVAGGAGLLPRASGRAELVLLAAYGAVSAVAFGWLLNLWFWPFTAGVASQVSFVPGAGVGENLRHWLLFNVATSLGYDLPRAVLTVSLVLVAGRPVLLALRRAARRAAFDAPVEFAPPAGPAAAGAAPAPAGPATARAPAHPVGREPGPCG